MRPITSLRARIGLHVALLIVTSLAIGIGAAVGIQSLHRDIGVAARGYRQLREVYEVGYHVAAARDALANHRPEAALASAQTAAIRLEAPSPDASLDAAQRDPMLTSVHRLAGELQRSDPSAEATIHQLLGQLIGVSTEIRQSVAARESDVERHRRVTFLHVCIFSALVLIVGILVGVRLHRSVVQPLDRLATGVRQFAAGRLDDRLDTGGDREFATLAADFNRMAHELQGLYNDLEERVQIKSRQLVQSERLASVGYLAAGVAHEINNPLGIIAGYGERSLQLLRKPALADDAIRSVDRNIGIICDEAFRCKQITDRLLMLARPGEQAKTCVSLARIANDVITSIGGLARFADRRLRLAADEQHPLAVFANEGELRQVILNLVINALEAVDPGTGEVNVTIAPNASEEIELTVQDNGRGIPPDALSKIFEPFFTDKRADRPGTGLGLSVAHAIIRECQGQIDAQSAGLGAGSRFIVRLPAAAPTVEVSHAGH